MLVKLTDISLTPFNNALGRMLYTFSATVTEVDEATLKNCDKYGTHYVGSYQTQVVAEDERIGQFKGIAEKNQEVLKQIEAYWSNKTIDGIKSQKEIADACNIKEMQVSRKIAKLEMEGLIERVAAVSSRNKIYIHTVVERAYRFTKEL